MCFQYYVVLAGNKCDLPKDSHVISPAKGKELASQLGCHFYSTSAKQNKNITELFEDCARQVVSGRKVADGGKKKKTGCTLL
jgi:GTPase SAR1 family protein